MRNFLCLQYFPTISINLLAPILLYPIPFCSVKLFTMFQRARLKVEDVWGGGRTAPRWLSRTELLTYRTPGETWAKVFYDHFRTRVRSLAMLVTDWLTDWLTDSCLVNLIDVTLACEDAYSKLVEVVTVADVSDEDRVGNSLLQIWKLRFGHKVKLLFKLWAQGLVKILNLKFRQDLKLEFDQITRFITKFIDQYFTFLSPYLDSVLPEPPFTPLQL